MTELFMYSCMPLSVVFLFLSLCLELIAIALEMLLNIETRLLEVSLIFFVLAGIALGMLLFVPSCVFLYELIGG